MSACEQTDRFEELLGGRRGVRRGFDLLADRPDPGWESALEALLAEPEEAYRELWRHRRGLSATAAEPAQHPLLHQLLAGVCANAVDVYARAVDPLALSVLIRLGIVTGVEALCLEFDCPLPRGLSDNARRLAIHNLTIGQRNRLRAASVPESVRWEPEAERRYRHAFVIAAADYLGAGGVTRVAQCLPAGTKVRNIPTPTELRDALKDSLDANQLSTPVIDSLSDEGLADWQRTLLAVTTLASIRSRSSG